MYVASSLSREVKRHDGETGAYLGNFVTLPPSLSQFGPSGLLFISIPEPTSIALALTGLFLLPRRR